jgi:hypothetical protein
MLGLVAVPEVVLFLSCARLPPMEVTSIAQQATDLTHENLKKENVVRLNVFMSGAVTGGGDEESGSLRLTKSRGI